MFLILLATFLTLGLVLSILLVFELVLFPKTENHALFFKGKKEGLLVKSYINGIKIFSANPKLICKIAVFSQICSHILWAENAIFFLY